MNTLKKILGICAVLLICANLAAQNKLGYINSAELLPMMSEYKQAEKSMETYSTQKRTQLENKYTSYQTMMQSYIDGKQKGLYSPVEDENKAKEIEALQQELTQMEQEIQMDVARKNEELLVPIQERALNAIKEVAAENGYTYIFDASAGGLIHFPEQDNVMDLVRAKLGI